MPVLYQNNQDVPEEMLLGNLLFYNLVGMTVEENDLIDVFNNNNMPQSYLRKISHADAFRRASSSIKNEKVVYEDDNGDQFDGRINVDEVVNDKMYIKRIIGVRVLNDQKEEVSYTQLGSISYDRANDCCATYLDPTSTRYVANISFLFSQVETRYNTWSTYHNHDTIKNTVNRIVDSMHPVALMPTGICKFIPKLSKDTLYSLKGILNDLSEYTDNKAEKNTVEIIPILDTQEHRNLVGKMYEEEIKETLYNYSMELTEVLKNKTVLTSRQANSYLERYKDLSDKVQAYQNLLGTYTENIQSQLKSAIQLINDNKEE
jgi:hypothetical protein